MAVLACSSSSNKENVPPPPSPHSVAVKSHRMKRPGACGVKARRRAPLRDITSLFLAAAGVSAAVPVPVRSREEPAPLPEAARIGAPAAVVAVKEKRSLRKEFR